MDDIAQQVRLEAQLPMWPIPDPDPDKPWVRFDCPFCDGKSGNTAAINYQRQRFECYRCDKTLGYSSKHNAEDDTTVARLFDEYREVISNIIGKIISKNGHWLSEDDLYTEAKLLLWNYSCRAYGGPNDAGMWDEWEAQTDGDPARMASFVGHVLSHDLANHARDTREWKRKAGVTNVPRGAQLQVVSTNHMPVGSSQGALMSLAENERVPFTSWGNPGCTRLRNGLWPIAGHCRRCDLALKTS